LTVKLRETEAALEPLLRKVFAAHVSRGKVEVTFRVRREAGARTDVAVDEALLAAIVGRIREVAVKLSVEARLEARDLLSIPGALSIESAAGEFSAEEIAAIEKVAEAAASALVAMREAEGREVAEDFAKRIAYLEKKAAELAARRGEIAARLLGNLRERLAALVPNLPLDSGRLEQEAALAVDRADVAEELQRLQGHLAQFLELLGSTGPVGKKLEFLSQEILRELNTLGSKAKDLQLVRDVLDMKSETEKIREQVQNVE
ncbi:MAG TPA: YicC/YloC family endoribonuclease, partial [Thermoanaerobaculia bacterium]|nr:YicC/YloC family endoribonuclease [Thermoanaerobaculia bacterium]